MHAEADVGTVLERPVGAETLVTRRPRRAVVGRLEEAVTLHDHPEMRRLVRVRNDRRQPEMPGRLLLGIVPGLPARLAIERGEERPRRAAVAALENAGRLDAREHAAVCRRERRGLRQLQAAAIGVAQALARLRPGLAQVGAPPDRGAMPLACRGGVDGAGGIVVHRVQDGPPFTERATHPPVATVAVAFDHEATLPRPHQQYDLRHRRHLRVNRFPG